MEMRITAAAEKALAKAQAAKDPKEVVRLLAPFVWKPFWEVKKTTEYSRSSGKPKRHKWVPAKEPWSGVLDNYSSSSSQGLSDRVASLLKKDKVIYVQTSAGMVMLGLTESDGNISWPRFWRAVPL